ncbi:DNA repair protein RecN [Gardnerella swidsinskii]|uniref:DNA repair protein RecN n=1 Tax=Gardnerella swidsinskii TaxID=2792979 RepID=UPI0036F47AD1
MLEELEIRNLGPISHALITPSSHMTAITGETGAGKSMLLSAIKLISGSKAEVARISPNAKEAWVQGIFSIPKTSELVDAVGKSGIELEPSENDENKSDMYVSRTVPQEGRSRATISGFAVPKTVLEQVCSRLIVIHGQSDQLRIATNSKQRELLDTVSKNSELLKQYTCAYQAWKDAKETCNRLENQASSSRQRADYLRESLARIRDVNPLPNEDKELRAKRERIENSAQIVKAVSIALASLDSSQIDYGASESSEDACFLVDKASQALRNIRVDDSFNSIANQLDDIHTQLDDIVMQLAQQLDIDVSEKDLDDLNSRIHDLTDLTRRWGPTLDDVLDWSEKAQFELEDLDDSPEAIAKARAKCAQRYDDALKLAEELYKTRLNAAHDFGTLVSEELNSLAMPGAQLIIAVNKRCEDLSGSIPLDANGCDDVEFLFRPFPASSDLPMSKSASGGELSRLMLAIELVVAKLTDCDEDSMTFIFDEVDSGVGGVAAVELGKRLAQLSKHAQVIVVTHLAQVASFADAQFAVQKNLVENSDNSENNSFAKVANTSVIELNDLMREQEIARMLDGSESKTSLEHARELLNASRKIIDGFTK